MDRPIDVALVMEWFGIVAVLAALGVLPSIIAFARGHAKRRAILVVNVLLGWTIVGWIVALVWSVRAFEKISEPPASAVSIRERSIANVERLAIDILQSGSAPAGATDDFGSSSLEAQQEGRSIERLKQDRMEFP